MISSLNIYIYIGLLIATMCIFVYIILLGTKKQGAHFLIMSTISSISLCLISLTIKGIETMLFYISIDINKLIALQYAVATLTFIFWFLFLYNLKMPGARRNAIWFASVILGGTLLFTLIYYLVK